MYDKTCWESVQERFRALDAQAIASIQDRKMRDKAMRLKGKQGGFTLLELLVVVAVLAIVAGTMITAMSGQEKRAASGAAASSIATVESLLRTYYKSSATLPDGLDALVSESVATSVPTALSTSAQLLSSDIIGTKLAKDTSGTGDKIKAVSLDQTYIDALRAAGITKVRVLAREAVNESTADVCATSKVENVALPCDQAMSRVDIPGRMFDNPTSGKNRGRGFPVDLPTGGTGAVAALPVWKSGATCDASVAETDPAQTGGADNLKLGASKCSVLVALGFGNNVTVGLNGEKPQMNSAPAYGAMLANQYNRYIALYNVGTGNHASNYPSGTVGTQLKAASTATLQALVDTRGDFLDEELAEASGQKQ